MIPPIDYISYKKKIIEKNNTTEMEKFHWNQYSCLKRCPDFDMQLYVFVFIVVKFITFDKTMFYQIPMI